MGPNHHLPDVTSIVNKSRHSSNVVFMVARSRAINAPGAAALLGFLSTFTGHHVVGVKLQSICDPPFNLRLIIWNQ